MLSELKDFTNVEVNNFQDEDISYVSDFPITHHCGFISFLPILIFIFSLLLCVMAPSPAQQIIQSDKLTYNKDTNLHAIESYVSNVKPMSEYMKISYRFDEVLNRSVSFSGKVSITCKKLGKILRTHEAHINETNLFASPINWSTSAIEVYHNKRIDYDSINVNFVFLSERQITETFTLIWESSDPNFILVYAITKVMASSSFLCLVTIFISKSFGSFRPTLLQKLTALLLFFSIFMFDPLSVGNLFQIMPFKIEACFLRDIYFGYFFFYTIAIFSFIGSERDQPVVQRFLVAFLTSIILTSAAMAFDIVSPRSHDISFMNSHPDNSSETTMVHIIIYCIYHVVLVICIIAARISITPKSEDNKEEEPHPQTDRFNYYCISTIPISLAFMALHFSNYFTYIQGTTINLMLPHIFAIMYGLIMDRAHTPTDGLQSGYVQVGDEIEEDNPFGIETDPNTLVIEAPEDA